MLLEAGPTSSDVSQHSFSAFARRATRATVHVKKLPWASCPLLGRKGALTEAFMLDAEASTMACMVVVRMVIRRFTCLRMTKTLTMEVLRVPLCPPTLKCDTMPIIRG